jgi:hypothetical protein
MNVAWSKIMGVSKRLCTKLNAIPLAGSAHPIDPPKPP